MTEEAIKQARALHERVHELTSLAVTKAFGAADDVRVPILHKLEESRVLQRAEMGALARAVLTLLGEKGEEVYLGYLVEELDLQVKALEKAAGEPKEPA
ncbi:hypothetical protein LCGC14_3029460 [marine sediment metagenome]|uniref:Uncharacterized protein n=1 Tax=marine sediment metagenome TaxID=412755 RepID=A0A0F8Z0P2_9ZZZZ